MSITGIHHVTLISANAARTLDFYTRVLGLRLLKQTVNLDDPTSYHLYFGNQEGKPGSIIAFYEWPGSPRGYTGTGGTHHIAFRVADLNGLEAWTERLTALGIDIRGPSDRQYYHSLYFKDPDGMSLEIATDGPGLGADGDNPPLVRGITVGKVTLEEYEEKEPPAIPVHWDAPAPQISASMSLEAGLHHISSISSRLEKSDGFYRDVLGLRRIRMTLNLDDPDSRIWYWGVDEGLPGTVVALFERPGLRKERAQVGAGQVHHFALSVESEEDLLIYQEKLSRLKKAVPVLEDRIYYKSLMFNDPDGQSVELATPGPGFTVDEPAETLGQKLLLPAWLEANRHEIELSIDPLPLPGLAHSQE